MCIPCPFIPSPKEVSEKQRKYLTSSKREKKKMKASIKIFQALEYISFFLSIISKLLCNRNKKSELYVWP